MVNLVELPTELLIQIALAIPRRCHRRLALFASLCKTTHTIVDPILWTLPNPILIICATKGCIAGASKALRLGANVRGARDALSNAVAKPHIEIMDLLLSEVWGKLGEKIDHNHGWELLHNAMDQRNRKAFQMLIPYCDVDDDGRATMVQTLFPMIVLDGDAAEVKRMLDQGLVKASSRGDFGLSPIGCAALAGRVEIMDILFNAAESGEIAEPSLNYGSYLSVAIRKGHVNIVRYLLESGRLDPNADMGGTDSLLQHVAYKKNGKIAMMLLEHDAQPDGAEDRYPFTPLHWACLHGNVKLATRLIEYGADINARQEPDYWIHSMLHCVACCPRNGVAIAELLAARGFDMYPETWDLFSPFIRSVNNWVSPLVSAVERGTLTMVEWLLNNTNLLVMSRGKLLSVVAENSFDHLPQHQLAKVKLLLQHGADPNAVHIDHNAPLHCLKRRFPGEAVEAMVAAGADIHLLNDYGETPLYVACRRGAVDAARVLLQHGADPNTIADNGFTPLHAACKVQYQEEKCEIIKALLQYGADVNARINMPDAGYEDILEIDPYHPDADSVVRGGIKDQWTALHRACAAGVASYVRILLDHGANPLLPAHDGRIPLHIAARRNARDCMDALLTYEDGLGDRATVDSRFCEDENGNTPVEGAMHSLGNRCREERHVNECGVCYFRPELIRRGMESVLPSDMHFGEA